MRTERLSNRAEVLQELQNAANEPVSLDKLTQFFANNKHLMSGERNDKEIHTLLVTIRKKVSEIKSAESQSLVAQIIDIADQVFLPGADSLPDEIWIKILQKPKRRVFEQTPCDQLRGASLTSRRMRGIVQEVRKNDAPRLDKLRTYPAVTATQAVDYLIQNPTIRYANLRSFHDLTDEDLSKLIANRPDLSGLYFGSDKVTDRSLSLLNHLTELREFSCEDCAAEQIDLSDCSHIESVSISPYTFINKNSFLKRIVLPEKADKLLFFQCSLCDELNILVLPEVAPHLRFVDVTLCNKLSNVHLPVSTPELVALRYSHCRLSSVSFPRSVPALEKLVILNNPELSVLDLPESAPLLKICNIKGCPQLLNVTLPLTAPQCTFKISGSPNLTPEHITNYHRYDPAKILFVDDEE